MDYKRVYFDLIQRSKIREEPEGYTERHHILPKCLGGSDDIENIAVLTAREHFIAHLLLHKIYGGKMTYVAFIMSNSKKYTNRIYEQARIEHAKQVSFNIRNHPTRGAKISKALSGKPKSEEHKKKWKESRSKGKGWAVSEETKLKKSILSSGENNGMYGKTHSEIARDKISQANKQTIKCPHCDKIGGIAIMKRWHFNNCKTIKGSL